MFRTYEVFVRLITAKWRSSWIEMDAATRRLRRRNIELAVKLLELNTKGQTITRHYGTENWGKLVINNFDRAFGFDTGGTVISQNMSFRRTIELAATLGRFMTDLSSWLKRRIVPNIVNSWLTRTFEVRSHPSRLFGNVAIHFKFYRRLLKDDSFLLPEAHI